MYDIIVIGAGPAGMTAAIYALRANKSVLIIEKNTFGGQITYSPKVENYPGFVSMSGNEFAEKLVTQVLELGGEFEMDTALEIKDGGSKKTVVCESQSFEGKAVIIASGAKHRMLGLKNEEKFVGEGISFCAVCDGAFYKDKEVFVIGGGNSALQEAILLSEGCKKVTVIQNLDRFTGEERLVRDLESRENTEFILGSTVSKILGNDVFEGIEIDTSGEKRQLFADGMFVAIGLVPENEAYKNVIDLTEYGYADSGEDCTTKTQGVFVAGDCRKKTVRQITTAASDGSIAALAACNYIDSLR